MLERTDSLEVREQLSAVRSLHELLGLNPVIKPTSPSTFTCSADPDHKVPSRLLFLSLMILVLEVIEPHYTWSIHSFLQKHCKEL